MNKRSTTLRLSAMFWLAQMAEGASLVLLSGHMGAMGFSGQEITVCHRINGRQAVL